MDGIELLEPIKVFMLLVMSLVVNWKLFRGKKGKQLKELTKCCLLPFEFTKSSSTHLQMPWSILSHGFRTTKSFCAKNYTDRRQYEYILPVYAIEPFNKEQPPCSVVDDVHQFWKEFADYEKWLQNPVEPCPFTASALKSFEVAKTLIENEASYSVYSSDAQDESFGGILPFDEWPSFLQPALLRMRACVTLFLGTHNFHNYTVSKTPMDPSAQRHLLSIVVSDPVRIHNELYLRVKIEGQSFMLHQIRKMMGMTVEVARGRCSLYQVYTSMSTGKMITPLAPSTGLFLDKVVVKIVVVGIMSSQCSAIITRR